MIFHANFKSIHYVFIFFMSKQVKKNIPNEWKSTYSKGSQKCRMPSPKMNKTKSKLDVEMVATR